METLRFKNRFRVKYNGKVLALNSVTNTKGYSQFVAGFSTLDEAVKTRRAYAAIRGIDENQMVIESYSESLRHWVPSFSVEANEYFKKAKTFSGKGLRFKNLESPKDGKYNPAKYYGIEVQFAKSVEFSKGKSVLPKEKKVKHGYVPGKYAALIKNDYGVLNLGESLITSLSKKGLGKKALRKYLRSNGYSVCQSISICEKVVKFIAAGV
ncbi:MAG: hypothetical protein KGQ83_09695 [Planctomycetes bacterium]|nr:hypothetical protein [Planctomycetota bacterium]